MPKRKKSYRHYTAKIPIALTIGFASSVLGGTDTGNTVLDHITRKEYQSAWHRLQYNFLGSYGGNPFNMAKLNIMPLIVGAGVSILASKFGLNRRLAAMGLPVKI